MFVLQNRRQYDSLTEFHSLFLAQGSDTGADRGDIVLVSWVQMSWKFKKNIDKYLSRAARDR